jgi:hypothetical protein
MPSPSETVTLREALEPPAATLADILGPPSEPQVARRGSWWSRWQSRDQGLPEAAALCKPAHRKTLWRVRGGPWVCGVCHPPAPGLETERLLDVPELVAPELAALVEAGLLVPRVRP